VAHRNATLFEHMQAYVNYHNIDLFKQSHIHEHRNLIIQPVQLVCARKDGYDGQSKRAHFLPIDQGLINTW
jgi:hypothetical protein